MKQLEKIGNMYIQNDINMVKINRKQEIFSMKKSPMQGY